MPWSTMPVVGSTMTSRSPAAGAGRGQGRGCPTASDRPETTATGATGHDGATSSRIIASGRRTRRGPRRRRAQPRGSRRRAAPRLEVGRRRAATSCGRGERAAQLVGLADRRPAGRAASADVDRRRGGRARPSVVSSLSSADEPEVGHEVRDELLVPLAAQDRRAGRRRPGSRGRRRRSTSDHAAGRRRRPASGASGSSASPSRRTRYGMTCLKPGRPPSPPGARSGRSRAMSGQERRRARRSGGRTSPRSAMTTAARDDQDPLVGSTVIAASASRRERVARIARGGPRPLGVRAGRVARARPATRRGPR